jgi:hypothetical protein
MDGSPDLSGVVVLGMDRSGTSAVTGMFQRSGYFVGGEEDLMKADAANPAGYFENLRVWETNEEVLADLGFSLSAPAGLAQIVPARRHTDQLQEVLDDLLVTKRFAPLALKDPRISMLIRLWRPVFDGILHPVLVVRHPHEVALSLERRDGTMMSAGLKLWEHRLSLLIERLDGSEVSVVPYSRLLREPSMASEIVAQASALLRRSPRGAVDSAAAGMALEPRLRRSRVESIGERGLSLTPNQLGLWRFLESLDAGRTVIKAPRWLRGLTQTAVGADARSCGTK